MKQTDRFILLCLFVVMLVLPFATAQSILQDIGEKIFGFSGLGNTYEIIAQLMIWLILFTAFSDILEIVFSNGARWLIGFGLVVIAANAGMITWINIWMFGATAALGSFSVPAVIGITFVAFLCVHFGLGWTVEWMKRTAEQRKLHQGLSDVDADVQTSKRVGKGVKK